MATRISQQGREVQNEDLLGRTHEFAAPTEYHQDPDQLFGNSEERSLTLRQVQTLQIGNAAIRIAVEFLLLTQGQQDLCLTNSP